MTDPAMFDSNFTRNMKDEYQTEPWVTEVLAKSGNLNSMKVALEPSCGNLYMVEVLLKYIPRLEFSDIKPPYNTDFLERTQWCENIITNPPYRLADKFIEHALNLTEANKGKVCMLLRNEFSCAKSRNRLFSHPTFDQKIELTSRPRWDEWWKNEKPKHSPRHNYAWYIWDWARDWEQAPIILWGFK